MNFRTRHRRDVPASCRLNAVRGTCARARASATRTMRVLGNAAPLPHLALKAYLCRLANTYRGNDEEGKGHGASPQGFRSVGRRPTHRSSAYFSSR